MFDVTKPVQTRDGRKARIICSDRKSFDGQLILVTLITEGNGTEGLYAHVLQGRYSTSHETSHDLINIPVKEERFHFCSKEGITYGTYCSTLEQAKEAFSRGVTIVAYGILKKTYIDDKLSALELVHIL